MEFSKRRRGRSGAAVLWVLCLAVLSLAAPVQGRVVTTVAGGGDGSGPLATDLDLSFVASVARDPQGRLLVGSHGLIHRIEANGEATRIAGVPGTITWRPTEGAATSIALGQLKSVAVEPGGDVFYADNGPYSRRIDQAGIVRNVVGMGWPGLPAAIVADRQGRLHVATPQRVYRADLQAGSVQLVAGNGDFEDTGDGGPATEAGFDMIRVLAFDRQNRLLIGTANRIRRVEADGTVSTILQVAGGVAGMDVGPDGTFYFSKGAQVFTLAPDGSTAVFAGRDDGGFSGDGGDALLARFASPTALLADADGSLLVADYGNRRVRLIAPGDAPPSVPDAPPAPVATAGDASATVVITPPAIDGGSAITAYTVTSVPAGGVDAMAGTTALQRTITGLERGRYYTFTVTASNVAGTSAPSPESERVWIAEAPRPVLRLAPVSVQEGDGGVRSVVVPATLSFAIGNEVRFWMSTYAGTATAGQDFVPRESIEMRIPAGQTRVDFTFDVIGDELPEPDETVRVSAYGANWVEGETPGVLVTILDDDQPAGTPPAPVARGERRVIDHSVDSLDIDVLANDDLDAGLMVGGSLSVVGAWPLGQATVVGDRIRFVPREGFQGEDRFQYRVCDKLGRCSEAQVTVVVRPVVGLDLDVASRSGHHRQPVVDLPPVSGLRFHVTPLVAPVRTSLAPVADDTPASPWDSPVGRSVLRLPMATEAGAGDVEHRLVAYVLGSTGGEKLDLYLGIDYDGDGQPGADEVICLDSQSATPRCDARMQRPGYGVDHYWVMLHNRNPGDATAELAIFDVPLLPADGTLVATGPGQLEPGATFDLKLGWNDPGLLPGEMRVGYVIPGPQVPSQGDGFPVRLRRTGNAEEPILLASGVPATLRLAPGSSHRRMFIDVPEGSTQLRVTTSAPDASFRIQLVHGGEDGDPADTSVPEAPAAAVAGAPAKRGDALQAVPAPGRWYVVASNDGASPGAMTITATVEGVAPVVRPGSYFNAARPGHGVFLYPAGNQWAGLWYAYDDDGRSTWYYLQGAAPGANGAWTGGLYRAAWHGTANLLVQVGRATVSPTGPDAFRFSYTLDGLSGSEPMAALGRGCPTLAGLPQDLSSHWFNRQRAGTGYSVQMWGQYEYLAAFVYDGRGEPRFLAGERSGFGGAEAVLALEQLSGACPTCAYVAPTRTEVGTLLRRIVDGALSRIELDVEYADGVPGTWTAVDDVQLLGGPGTTQGCQP